MSDHKHVGPMHGERTRRHQIEVDGPREDRVALSVYEHQKKDGPRLALELMETFSIRTRVDLTLVEVVALREWLAEFIVAWKEPDDTA